MLLEKYINSDTQTLIIKLDAYYQAASRPLHFQFFQSSRVSAEVLLLSEKGSKTGKAVIFFAD